MTANQEAGQKYPRLAQFVLGVLVLGPLMLACGWPGAVAARGSAPDLVSYLVCADCDTNAFIPGDREYRFLVPDLAWQWRLFDPTSGRDTLLFDVPSFPLMVEWDSTFTYVEFISGNRLMAL